MSFLGSDMQPEQFEQRLLVAESIARAASALHLSSQANRRIVRVWWYSIAGWLFRSPIVSSILAYGSPTALGENHRARAGNRSLR